MEKHSETSIKTEKIFVNDNIDIKSEFESDCIPSCSNSNQKEITKSEVCNFTFDTGIQIKMEIDNQDCFGTYPQDMVGNQQLNKFKEENINVQSNIYNAAQYIKPESSFIEYEEIKDSIHFSKINLFSCVICKCTLDKNSSYSVKNKLNYHFCKKCFKKENLSVPLPTKQEKNIETASNKNGKYKCSECEKTFNYKNVLVRHNNSVHQKTKNFKCTECNKMFSDKFNFIRHIDTVHKKIKKFQCTECDHTSSARSDLRKHVDVVHRKMRKFKCSECDYSNTRDFRLQLHIDAVHRKLTKFKCIECDYTNFSVNRLREHIDAVHRNLRNFQCSECGFMTYYKANLVSHIRVIHPIVELA